MKVKVSEATGPALDWMVSKCLRGSHTIEVIAGHVYRKPRLKVQDGYWFQPSTNWSLGGPIIEREGIATRRSKGKWYAMLSDDLGDGERAPWSQFTFRNVPKSAPTNRKCRYEGPTQLIAAMRCFVGFNLGDEVDVPEELL